jgi:hypothetical protein
VAPQVSFEVDAFRNPHLYVFDVRVEKEFRIERARWAFDFDIFNLFNRASTLQRFSRTNTATKGQVREILSPRIVRLGMRLTF